MVYTTSSVRAQNWDVNTLKWANRMDGKFVRNFSKGVVNTEPIILVGVPIALATYGYLQKDKSTMCNAVYIGSSVAEIVIISSSLKDVINRKRPFEKYPDKIIARVDESGNSFPSNHTSAAFSLATSLSLTYHKWYIIIPSYAWATSVGFARMNQGVHYTSDVLGGAVIGSGVAVLNYYLNKWLQKKYVKNKQWK